MKSYFIDTNYFLRLFIKDNSAQYTKVYSLFQKAVQGKVEIHTSVVVFFEIYWVLLKFYNYDKSETINFLAKVIRMDFLVLENKDILQNALELFSLENLDLEDCYNMLYFKAHSLSDFATFDKKLSNTVDRL